MNLIKKFVFTEKPHLMGLVVLVAVGSLYLLSFHDSEIHHEIKEFKFLSSINFEVIKDLCA